MSYQFAIDAQRYFIIPRHWECAIANACGEAHVHQGILKSHATFQTKYLVKGIKTLHSDLDRHFTHAIRKPGDDMKLDRAGKALQFSCAEAVNRREIASLLVNNHLLAQHQSNRNRAM